MDFSLLSAYLKKFHPLKREAEDAIFQISKLTQVVKHDNLQSFGHTCKTIYFINKGLARIYYYKDGNDITESFSFENNIIARVESLFSGKPCKLPLIRLYKSRLFN